VSVHKIFYGFLDTSLSGEETKLLEKDFSNVDNVKCAFSQNIAYIWIRIWDPPLTALLVLLREGEQGSFNLKTLHGYLL
jgi:hypothetical protein